MGFGGIGSDVDVGVLLILQPVGLAENLNAYVVVKDDEKDKEKERHTGPCPMSDLTARVY